MRTAPRGVVVVTALMAAATGLSSVPTAGATCASFFGIGNSAQCTSSRTSIAIALGDNAVAAALGVFSIATAAGENSQADAHDGNFLAANAFGIGSLAQAYDGSFEVANALGNRTTALAYGGGLNLALAGYLGTHAAVRNSEVAVRGGNLNAAIGLTANRPNSDVAVDAETLGGTGNLALAVGNSITTAKAGHGNSNHAMSLGVGATTGALAGNRNRATAVSTQFGWAAAAGGTGNRAIAVGSFVQANYPIEGQPSSTGDRNLSIAVGGGAVAENVVDGSNNLVIAVGGGARGFIRGSAGTATTSNRNVAIVIGNNSEAFAGPGDRYHITVIGNDAVGAAPPAAAASASRTVASPKRVGSR
jgi:hypothetical protein